MAESEKNTIGALKNRLANYYINQVSLSESLKIVQNACVNTANQTIDKATEDQLSKIKQDLEEFEKNIQENQAAQEAEGNPENVTQAEFSSGPETTCNESSGPVVPIPTATPEQKGVCVSGPSGPDSGI